MVVWLYIIRPINKSPMIYQTPSHEEQKATSRVKAFGYTFDLQQNSIQLHCSLAQHQKSIFGYLIKHKAISRPYAKANDHSPVPACFSSTIVAERRSSINQLPLDCIKPAPHDDLHTISLCVSQSTHFCKSLSNPITPNSIPILLSIISIV